MNYDQPIHPVTRENRRVVRPKGRCWKLVAEDRHGMNPALVGYSTTEPTERRVAQFRGHYAHLIYAMPREVDVRVSEETAQ